MSDGCRAVGSPVTRKDGVLKVCGKARFTDDLKMPGMLHARVVRSTVPHARLKSIDTGPARSLPGVAAVLTAGDIPGKNRVGIVKKDEPVLVDDKIRRFGDALALVAADTPAAAKAAAGAVRVRYEELEAVFDAGEALLPGAPAVHEQGNLMMHRKIRRGDIAGALAQADVLIEKTYRTQMVEHAYIEPEAGIALREGDTVTLWVSTQNAHFDRGEVARTLGVGEHRVRVIQQFTGGGFGGKLDISVQCHIALLAWVTKRPVKLVYEREESIMVSAKRHPYVIHYKTAADRTGKLMGVEVSIIMDSGAYASYGPAVATRAAVHATGPYAVPNASIDVYGVYTNNPIGGAMRGFGVPQVSFAYESQMDLLARKTGLDPWDIRRRNFLTPGAVTATGQVLEQSVGITKTLEEVSARCHSGRKAAPTVPSSGL